MMNWYIGRQKNKTISHDYHVAFFITTKRKKFEDVDWHEQTGKGGIKGIIWAKNCLIDFINSRKDWKEYGSRIFVGGSDTRRQKIYERSLIPIGFVKEKSWKCRLVYEI